MKRLVRKWLMGDNTFSAYSRITAPDGIQEKVYLTVNGQTIDVSDNHWLLCIEPIVYGMWIAPGDRFNYKDDNQYQLHIILPDKTKINAGEAVASLELEFMDCLEERDGMLLLLKLQSSKIFHLTALKRWIIFKRYYAKNGMTYDRFKSFVSAYSYPRHIRLISFREHDYYNIFPMDLLGSVNGHNKFVFGLRHTNVALPKIIIARKMVVCEVSYQYKDIIYKLGDHHSSVPPLLEQLPFKTISTKNFGFPVPEWVASYKEIEIVKTRNMGSHMLMLGTVSHEEKLFPAQPLYLIHFLQYLQQKKKGGNYLLA